MILLLWLSVMLGCVDLFCAEAQMQQRFLVPVSIDSKDNIQLFLYKESGEKEIYNGLPVPDDVTIEKDKHWLDYTHEGVIFYFFLKNKTLPNDLNNLFDTYVAEKKLGLPISFLLKAIYSAVGSGAGFDIIIDKPLLKFIEQNRVNLDQEIRALQKEISKEARILREKEVRQKEQARQEEQARQDYHDLVRRTATNQKVPTETSKTPTNSVPNVLVVHKDGQYYVVLWSKKDSDIYTYNLINTKKLNEWASHKAIQQLGETYYCDYKKLLNLVDEEKRRSLVFIARSDFNRAQKEQFEDKFTPNHKGIINEITFEIIKTALDQVDMYNRSNDKSLSNSHLTITSPGKPQSRVYIFKEGQTYYYILKSQRENSNNQGGVNTYSYDLPKGDIVSILNDKSMQQTKLGSNITLVEGGKDLLLQKGYVLVATSGNVQSNTNVSALRFDKKIKKNIMGTGTINLDPQLIQNVNNALSNRKPTQSASVSSASASTRQPVGWWGILSYIGSALSWLLPWNWPIFNY